MRPLVYILRPLAVVLILGLMVGCMVSQPTWRSNKPSTRTVDAQRLEKHVRMLSEQLVPRDWEHPEHLLATAEYIEREWASSGATLSRQSFAVQGETYHNVLARFAPDRTPRIIVGAHYDAYADLPGADDNASGVAGLIELARLIGQVDPPPPVDLIAYTLEEPPFFSSQHMGSAHHADSVADNPDDVLGVIVLEMIGYFSDTPGSQSFPLPFMSWLYPDAGNFIGVIGRMDQGRWIKSVKIGMKGTTDLPVYSMRGPAHLGVDLSDHRSYWPHDIPAVMVTDTAFHRNTAYHTANDTADRLDYPRMAMVVVAVYEAILQLTPPTP